MPQTASIIDYPRKGLDEAIWDTTGEELQLQPNIRDEIEDIIGSFMDDLDLPTEALIDVFIYGSMLTNQYNSKTDVDARILLDPEIIEEHYPGIVGRDLYDLTRDTIHGVPLGDTKHPFNASVIIEGEETEIGQSALGITERDPVYSMKEGKVIHEGIGYDESFDPDVEFMEERGDIVEIMTKLDKLVQDAKTDTIDIELLEEAVGEVSNPDALIEKIEDRLGNLNLTIEKMVDEFVSLREERSESYKEQEKEENRHKAPGNIRYKFLEKYRYLDMLKKLKRLFTEGDGIEPEEVEDVAEALNVKAYPYKQVAPPEIEEAPPTSRTGPPGYPTVDEGRIDEGGMLHQPQGATCPRCGHVNPMTASESERITCESCGKKFEAKDGFSMGTGESLPSQPTPYPYESDFKLYSQTMSPQIVEDMVRLLKDVGVSEDALKLFEKKLKGEPLEEEETRPELPEEVEEPQQPGQMAPIKEQPPEPETGVKTVLKPGLEMNRLQAPIATKAKIYKKRQFLEAATLGEEFQRTDADEYAVILEEMSEPEKGPYRVQWYTSKAPIGHTTYPTFEMAAEKLFEALGPSLEIANGSMDAFALSDEWARALTWLTQVKDEDIGGWLDESTDDIKKGHLLFGAIIMDDLIRKLEADSTGGTGGPFGGPPGENPGDDPYSSGGGALAEYGKEGDPDKKDKKKKDKKKAPDDDVIWEVVTVLEGIDILPFLEDDALLEELLAAFPFMGEASKKIDKIIGLYEEPAEGTGQYRAPVNPDYDTTPKGRKERREKRREEREERRKSCPLSPVKEIKETGEAVGINWFDKYPSKKSADEEDFEEEMLEEDNDIEEPIDTEEEDGSDLDEDYARMIGEKIGIEWDEVGFDPEQFLMGIEVEFEHGSVDPETNVTDDDVIETAKIAWAHLKELDDYYYKLKEMEEDAEEKTGDSEESDEESSGGSVGGFTEGFPASKTAAAYMTLCPNCRTIQKAPIEGEGVICPFCSRGWLDSLETSDPEKYREYKERTEHESEKMHERRREERGVPRVSMYIEPKLRKKVNAELRNAGMDGNGRFETAGAALTEAIEIISNYGLRPTVDVSQGLGDSDILTEDFRNEGSRNLELETLDGEPVENSMLVFRYYQFLETGKYEILAMLS
jgi:hypothetical protein